MVKKRNGKEKKRSKIAPLRSAIFFNSSKQPFFVPPNSAIQKLEVECGKKKSRLRNLEKQIVNEKHEFIATGSLAALPGVLPGRGIKKKLVLTLFFLNL